MGIEAVVAGFTPYLIFKVYKIFDKWNPTVVVMNIKLHIYILLYLVLLSFTYYKSQTSRAIIDILQ
jgi:hypothetical protein